MFFLQLHWIILEHWNIQSKDSLWWAIAGNKLYSAIQTYEYLTSSRGTIEVSHAKPGVTCRVMDREVRYCYWKVKHAWWCSVLCGVGSEHMSEAFFIAILLSGLKCTLKYSKISVACMIFFSDVIGFFHLFYFWHDKTSESLGYFSIRIKQSTWAPM